MCTEVTWKLKQRENIVDPFMPSGCAKHRVSRHAAKGRQGVEDDDDEEDNKVIFVKHDRCKNPPRRKRGKNQRYSPPNPKGRPAPAEGNGPDVPMVPQAIEDTLTGG